MEKGCVTENCDSAQIVEGDDSEVQTDPETNQRKMRLGTHRTSRTAQDSKTVPKTIGWRLFVQVISNIFRRLRIIKRD
ncbi:hypothetical protein CEXT_385891 [Caerostris extrusa]|uniref:Uncharacterized protein n=1 Tax=Caerostris extrusa TaxID=172846 RepID=A0AAV4P0J0_CAEEX|nr:hypothetical protein CEXT_385891 [Caerostris extrusa]